MKPIILILLLFLSSLSLSSFTQEKEIVVSYTLAGRDRTISTETKSDMIFDSILKKFDYTYWLLGVIITLNLITLGYMIWYRRTALRPDLDKATLADAKCTILISVLREYAKTHPDLAEIMKSHGLL